MAVHTGFEGHPSAQRVAGDVRAVETLLVEEGLELVAQHVLDGASVGHQLCGFAVAGQVDQDHLAVFGEQVHDRVPGLAPVRDPMDEDQRFAGSVPLAREHAPVPSSLVATYVSGVGNQDDTYL